MAGGILTRIVARALLEVSPTHEGHWTVFISAFMRFHVCSEQGVDPRLIPWSVGFEPIQDLTIQTDGDGSFRLGQP